MARLSGLRSDLPRRARVNAADRQTVRVLLRPDCHLCHDALAKIEGFRGSRGEFRLEVIDIDSDSELLRMNLERIPVVEVDGRQVSELEFDEAAFLAALDSARP